MFSVSRAVILAGVLGGVAFAGGACSYPHNNGNAAATWQLAARELTPKIGDLSTAQKAGNIQHAAQIREDIIKTCRIYWPAQHGGSPAEQTVREFCAAMGAPFP